MIIITEAEYILHRVSYSFMTETLTKLNIEATLHYTIKEMNTKTKQASYGMAKLTNTGNNFKISKIF